MIIGRTRREEGEGKYSYRQIRGEKEKMKTRNDGSRRGRRRPRTRRSLGRTSIGESEKEKCREQGDRVSRARERESRKREVVESWSDEKRGDSVRGRECRDLDELGVPESQSRDNDRLSKRPSTHISRGPHPASFSKP